MSAVAESEPLVDVQLLTRIASIETKMRRVCDLIPLSTWGFSSDVQEKLRQRKHRIVNQQLTPKERKQLTNSRKQQVARTVGGVCKRVSEVIDLLGASSTKDVQPKKASLPSEPKGKVNENGNGEQAKKPKESVKKTADTKESDSDSDESDENIAPTALLKASTRDPESDQKIESLSTAVAKHDSSDIDSTDEEEEQEAKTKKLKPLKRPMANAEAVEAKKPKLSNEPVHCVSKDQSMDVLEQREMAIRKLQEKLKAMKANRQSKKKATADPMAAMKFEQERKLKRRMSKMKMKQRRSEEKREKVDVKAETKKDKVETKDEPVSFSKFDFLIKADGKKKRLTTSEKKQKFTGKDYKSLINKVEKRDEKLEKLREKEPERAVEVEEDIKWNRAVKKAQGVKVKDNIDLLKKGLKRKEKMKEKRKEQWSNREKNVERDKAKKQEKRRENLQKRIDDKKKNKLKVMRKKGRIL